MTDNNVNEFLKFIKKCPSPYHTVNTVRERLLAEGYRELFEEDDWQLSPNGKYFVCRNLSSIIAFRTRDELSGFVISASHSDFPAFCVKGEGACANGAYTRLSVERYGGSINYTWFDRPLSIAGRAVVKKDGKLEVMLVDVDRDLLVIPSVAIHMNRTVNEKFSPNLAVDMLPLVATAGSEVDVKSIVADNLGVSADSVVSYDLFTYVRQPGAVLGANDDFIVAPRIDNLGSVYATLEAFLAADDKTGMTPVLAVFDNEEVGSATKQGAASQFFADTLQEIAGKRSAMRRALAKSYMMSVDNAHAVHPNHPELSDLDNAPKLNGGVVIKYNACQKYTTDAVSSAIFKTLADRCGAPVQTYYNRADMPGGSTLGSIANTNVAVSTIDIGLPQLAMHSAVETAGARDLSSMIKAVKEAYSAEFDVKSREIVIK